MERTTQKRLEFLCDRINSIKNTSARPYENVNDKLVAQIGNFHLSLAYGGVSLHQMVGVGGGVRDVFSCGHITKRDLYNRMNAFLSGIIK